ncbi:hypothetical protein [Mycobacterium sp. OTB74]|jgi:hypothetical protein|uniref:hypothetical protein n=1 Tax=Mycobacterium sp. OTB74 TaxID=1853452 RepID=UPI002473DD5C|nr:hypothetical protein [Mycobacterium sp. OTB74]MDH6244042.1 hypothetical protein [Mycobacterium sp. OTB74]
MIEPGHLVVGQVLAVLIGAAEVGFVIYAMARHPRRGRRWPQAASRSTVAPTAVATVRRPAPRPRTGTCEEVIVRQRLAGQIDATTYQARMTALVRDKS